MNFKTMLQTDFDLTRYGLADFDAVILANGEPPYHPIPKQVLRKAPFVVCCDGAIEWCDRADAVVGDCDSIPSWARKMHEKIIQQESEQDDNDLTKATRFCIEKGFRHIVYLGATGFREDHTLGNISLMMRYACEGLQVGDSAGKVKVKPVMITNCGWFVPAQGTVTFESFPGQQVSIFNFGCRQLRTEGLLYDGYPFTQLWQGTLNEAAADSFVIEADGDYLVFRTFEGKMLQ